MRFEYPSALLEGYDSLVTSNSSLSFLLVKADTHLLHFEGKIGLIYSVGVWLERKM